MTAFSTWAQALLERLPPDEPALYPRFRGYLGNLSSRTRDWAVAPIARVSGVLTLGFRPMQARPIEEWPVVVAAERLSKPIASSWRTIVSAHAIDRWRSDPDRARLGRNRQALLNVAAVLGDEAAPEVIARILSGQLGPEMSLAEAYAIAEGERSMLSRYHTAVGAQRAGKDPILVWEEFVAEFPQLTSGWAFLFAALRNHNVPRMAEVAWRIATADPHDGDPVGDDDNPPELLLEPCDAVLASAAHSREPEWIALKEDKLSAGVAGEHSRNWMRAALALSGRGEHARAYTAWRIASYSSPRADHLLYLEGAVNSARALGDQELIALGDAALAAVD